MQHKLSIHYIMHYTLYNLMQHKSNMYYTYLDITQYMRLNNEIHTHDIH